MVITRGLDSTMPTAITSITGSTETLYLLDITTGALVGAS